MIIHMGLGPLTFFSGRRGGFLASLEGMRKSAVSGRKRLAVSRLCSRE